MIFVFDIDDTLCKTNEYFEMCIDDYIKKNNLKIKKIEDTSPYIANKYDWNNETAKKWYKQNGDRLLGEIPCKENVVETLKYLHNNGHKIILATARSKDWYQDPELSTLYWLKKNDIVYDKLFIACEGIKEKICEIVNADFFVDDDIKMAKTVLNFFKHNIKVFLADANHNKGEILPEGITRLNNFSNLCEISKLKNKEKPNKF